MDGKGHVPGPGGPGQVYNPNSPWKFQSVHLWERFRCLTRASGCSIALPLVSSAAVLRHIQADVLVRAIHGTYHRGIPYILGQGQGLGTLPLAGHGHP